MVGMEDESYKPRRHTDSGDEELFRAPPALFLDDDDDLDDAYGQGGAGSSAEYEPWSLELDFDEGEGSGDSLLPESRVFDLDDGALDDGGRFGDTPLVPGDQHDGMTPVASLGPSTGLGPSWTAGSGAPVVLHPAPPEIDHEWSGTIEGQYPAPRSDNDEGDTIDDEGSFKRSRRLNRVLMALTVLVVAGVVGGLYMYLNRQPTTQTATEDAQASPSEGTDTGETTSAAGSATTLAGQDPVAMITTSGSLRIATPTETDASAAEFDPNTGLGEPTFVALTDTLAYMVNADGMAWQIDYRTDPTPRSLVDLNKDNPTPPAATTIYHFESAPDGTIYFTDVNGNLWSLDPTPSAVLVYTPQTPDAAVAQLATNPTTLYIRTIAGDVYTHDHGGEGVTLAYGPSSENPVIASLAPTQTGVILTAGGGIVRVVDPSKDPPLSPIYKPNGDKAVQAIAAGTGAAIVTQSGNVVYSVLGAKDVAIYTADPAADKPAASTIYALGNGTIGALDTDGNLWALDVAAENPTKIWDAASLGPVAVAKPNQDAFAVSDAQGNVWTVPTTPGASAQQLSSAGDARSIATSLFSLDSAAS